ncbi:MAG: DNA gyrase inhibitor YacG [Mangrovicoccus sp.]|nr:DNA gyrase inhibitor YacG [Mangrovicoccus sp.]
MTCPICAKDTQQRYRPFCSKRCADLDLGHWLNGEYRVPVEEDGEQPENNAFNANSPLDTPERLD